MALTTVESPMIVKVKKMECPKCGNTWISDKAITMVIRKTSNYKPDPKKKRYNCVNCGNSFD